jgi:chaperonin GroES
MNHKGLSMLHRNISPLGFRVLVRVIKDDSRTDAGLYLPEGAKEKSQESYLGEVLEVASAIDEDTDEETNISGIPLGAMVLISTRTGVKVPWDEDLRIVETGDVLAIVDELDIV